MVFKTKLIGQNEIESILNRILEEDKVSHIFVTSTYGGGKTTIMKEFIKAYYEKNKIKDTSEWIMNLSSEKDRGIHCIRQNVAEFVHHSSAKSGVYRWILVDDADSLPIISQQALRRPMETHSHTTRFFFCSRYPSDLIAPLKSRCLHLELETISTYDFLNYYLDFKKVPFKISLDGITFLLTIAQIPSQIETYINILHNYYADKSIINIQDINLLFGSPSYNVTIHLIENLIKKNNEEIIKLFFKIWTTGISYEDFLYELNTNIKQIGILKPKTSQQLYYMIMKGWIQYAQGKTHSFDMLRLMLV
jgi:DNA polymerase III delta prime subunit